MTQAIALADFLSQQGHEVTRVVVGRSERRTIPPFFRERIGARIFQIDSPNFEIDKDQKAVSLKRSIWKAVKRTKTYFKSFNDLHKMVREDSPDVIINFYDFIGGIYNWIRRPDAKFICIAHQYLAGHSTFEFPEGPWIDRFLMKLGNQVTSFGAHQKLALSFRELPDEPGIEVVPPLLRKEVTQLQVKTDEHLLVYMLNHGYAESIDAFHQQFPEEKLHCFWDNPNTPKTLSVDKTLTYHHLDDQLFLEKMSSCRGFLSTAGFESICEAMYLGKPVMLMPVEGHYEQACNALDAVNCGAGIRSNVFDLKKLVDYLPEHQDQSDRFRRWCDRSEAIFLAKLAPVKE